MKFPMSKERWEELNDEQVEAIMASDSPMYDCISHINGQHTDHGYNSFGMDEKRWKKVDKTLLELCSIITERATETLIIAFDDYIYEVEHELYDGRTYDVMTVMEWTYLLQIYRERAIELEQQDFVKTWCRLHPGAKDAAWKHYREHGFTSWRKHYAPHEEI